MLFLFKRLSLYIKFVWYHILFYVTPALEENHYSKVGSLYFKYEEYRSAIFYFKKAEKAHGGKNHSLTKYNAYYIGYSYLNLGNHIETAKSFEKYLALVPNDTEIIEVVGWCYRLQNKNEVALRMYTRLIELEKESISPWVESAYILNELGRKNEAYKQLKGADKCKNNDVAKEKLLKGIKYYFDGDLKRAAEEVMQAINFIIEKKSGLHDLLGDLYILLSNLYREDGNKAGAIETLERIYDINPDDLWSANALAFEYAEQEVQLSKAIEIINRCLMYQPENSLFLDTKGWILHKMGDDKSAKKFINDSLNFNPHGKDAREHQKLLSD